LIEIEGTIPRKKSGRNFV